MTGIPTLEKPRETREADIDSVRHPWFRPVAWRLLFTLLSAVVGRRHPLRPSRD